MYLLHELNYHLEENCFYSILISLVISMGILNILMSIIEIVNEL